MSRTSIRAAVRTPRVYPAHVLRIGLGIAAVALLLAFNSQAGAQQTSPPITIRPVEAVTITHRAPVPFAVGEELVFRATFGKVPAGTARMRVQGIDVVRGRPAYHVVFKIDGGVLFFRVHDIYESWMDVETLSSLRYKQTISEGRYHRNTTYELYPERAEYQKNSGDPQPSVANPLDDGSFIYAVRTAGLHVGDTVRNDRYFIPNENPVVLTALREDTVTVGAGTYAATVIRPSIRTSGIFSEKGDAEVWFSTDDRHLPVLIRTRFSRFSLTLTLQSVTLGDVAPLTLAKR